MEHRDAVPRLPPDSCHYFDNPSKWGAGVVWTDSRWPTSRVTSRSSTRRFSDDAQFHVVDPDRSLRRHHRQQRYDPTTNPGGVRCTIQDAAINVLGPRLPALWTAQEKQIGRGFAGVPVDNVGVQYGLLPCGRARSRPRSSST